MKQDKRLKIYRLVAGLLLVFDIPLLLIILYASIGLLADQNVGSGVVGLVLSVPFFTVFAKAVQVLRLSGKYDRYVKHMLIMHSGDTKALAREVGKPLGDLKRDLREMGRRGYFREARITGDYDYISMPGTGNPPHGGRPVTPVDLSGVREDEGPEAERKAEKGQILVKCPHCGAEKLMPPGKAGQCDFCQMMIQAPKEDAKTL